MVALALGACTNAPHSCNPTVHIPECDGPTTSPFYHKCRTNIGTAQVVWPGGPTEDDVLTVANLAIARNECVTASIERDRGVLIVVGTGCR